MGETLGRGKSDSRASAPLRSDVTAAAPSGDDKPQRRSDSLGKIKKKDAANATACPAPNQAVSAPTDAAAPQRTSMTTRPVKRIEADDDRAFDYKPVPRIVLPSDRKDWVFKNGTKLTRTDKRAFVERLAESGTATAAARSLGFPTADRFVGARRVDAAFDEAWKEALAQFADKIELEAFRRSYEGVEEPMVSMGKVVTTRVVYDNRLLETVLRAKKPVEYAIRQQVTHDISDRLADRLDAARARMLGQIEAPTIDQEPMPEPQR